jgi:uncharacterized protein (TIGR04255 family)
MEAVMPFKKVKRVIYKKNPLVSVTCQLRFPCILSINENPPVAFQEQLRNKYPLYHEMAETLQTLSFPLIPDKQHFNTTISDSWNNYAFSSDDNDWTINLTSTFLSLSTTKYQQWENFELRLLEVLSILNNIYNPIFFERIGLRYINVFRPSSLGLKNTAWNKLIHPFALGFLSCDNIKNDVTSYNSTTELNIGNTATARIFTGLGYARKHNIQSQIFDTELSFIVDSDLFFGKKQINETESAIKYLHESSTNLIRAIITTTLHKAMEPESI